MSNKDETVQATIPTEAQVSSDDNLRSMVARVKDHSAGLWTLCSQTVIEGVLHEQKYKGSVNRLLELYEVLVVEECASQARAVKECVLNTIGYSIKTDNDNGKHRIVKAKSFIENNDDKHFADNLILLNDVEGKFKKATLRNFVPKKKASAGKGGSKNSTVATGEYEILGKSVGSAITELKALDANDPKIEDFNIRLEALLAEVKQEIKTVSERLKDSNVSNIVRRNGEEKPIEELSDAEKAAKFDEMMANKEAA